MLKNLFKKKPFSYIDLPIYSICTFHHLIVFSGGGGHGISNQILVYHDISMKQLTKLETHNDIIENMVTNTPISLIACSANSDILIYSIKLNGSLELQWRFRSDYLLKNSTLNSVQWRRGTPVVACGGDDSIVRVYKLNPKEKKEERVFELLEHNECIKHIDMHQDSPIMVSSDNFVICISNYATKNLLGVLDSSRLRPYNTEFQAGYYLSSQYLLVVSYQPRGHTFVSKFNTLTGEIKTKKIIADQSCLTAKAPDLSYIAVASGNGTVQAIKTNTLQKYGVSQRHDMVIKGIDFCGNSKVVSGTPECSYHIQTVREEDNYLYVILVGLVLILTLMSSVTGEL